MTVHFIGAGPGAPDLITVRGLRLIQRCPLCLYAGSLVPAEVVAEAPGRVVDTASMHLDEILAEIRATDRRGQDVARVHSGDPSLYSAISEQIRRLETLGIAWTITPGVPAFAAAAAALGGELTLPDIAQSVVVTRTAVRASAMPKGESLAAFAATGATLCIHLSINNLAGIVRKLVPILGENMPVAVVHRASWPDQRILRGTLATIRAEVKAAGITRTALIMVGRVLGETAFSESRLYAADHSHVLRPRMPASQATASGTEPAAPAGG
jgi:precorrin-4/cobalt-precorrin-4 C11-methyltransferase